MEFLAGAICGIALTWWVFSTWIRPKPPGIRYITKCERLGCDFISYMNDYPTIHYVAKAHEDWHKEQEQINAGS